MQDGTLEDNIPPSSIECADEKGHSDTRGTYLLDDEETAALKDHPRVEYCHVDYQSYPGTYAPEPGEIHATPQYKKRFEKDVINYRAWNTGPTDSRPPQLVRDQVIITELDIKFIDIHKEKIPGMQQTLE